MKKTHYTATSPAVGKAPVILRVFLFVLVLFYLSPLRAQTGVPLLEHRTGDSRCPAVDEGMSLFAQTFRGMFNITVQFGGRSMLTDAAVFDSPPWCTVGFGAIAAARHS